jgi:hypothetical protein
MFDGDRSGKKGIFYIFFLAIITMRNRREQPVLMISNFIISLSLCRGRHKQHSLKI